MFREKTYSNVLLLILIRYYGQISMKVAVSYHLRARVQSCRGDFRGALQSEKETFGIYKAQVHTNTYFLVPYNITSSWLSKTKFVLRKN